MKYCTWKENGMSFIFEDGYIINPYNGDSSYMGEDIFKAAYKEPDNNTGVLRNEDDNRQTDCLHKQMQVCN